MENRKRPFRLGVYFTESEYQMLRKKAESARLTMGEFIRRCIAEKEIKQAPPVEMLPLMRHIHRVGDNLNQLLKHVNSGNPLEVPQMRKVLDQISQAADTVIKAYMTED